ncbi:hypothetical protein D3C73_498340 [compost metagenome]
MKRWTSLLAFILMISLLTACTDAGKYVKDTYPLVSADGNGNNLSKIYSVEGKKVPVVANELAEQETPKETSKESEDQMFLLYDSKIINIQKDPSDSNHSLVQVDSIQYAKEHYSSTFLQGYLAASLLQSVLGGGWNDSSSKSSTYKGYTQSPTYKKPNVSDSDKDKKPSTSDRTGSFSSSSKSATSNNKATSNSNIGSTSSGSKSTVRKNDGSTTNRVSTSTKSSNSKPSTSKKSGSFTRKK